MSTAKNDLPRWNLNSVYTSSAASEFKRDLALLPQKIDAFLALVQRTALCRECFDAGALLALINAFEEAGDYAENLSAYCEAVWTTDTRNQAALAEINAVDAAKLPLAKATVLFRAMLFDFKDEVLQLSDSDPAFRPYRFFLEDCIAKAACQMPAEMEDLAGDLARSGGDAWSRLHDNLVATAWALWDDDGVQTQKTITALRELDHDPRRNVREKAYRAELEACRSIEDASAAALNGVKGWSITLDKRRGWKSPLEKAAFQSRVSEKTLDALISAMENSLPMFRRYLKAKAKVLGLEKCAFFDLFAPMGKTGSKKYSWHDACNFVVSCFAKFDPSMADFAARAFEQGWIDAEPRLGKVGGAYCTDFPLARESRILCNFDGTFDAVSTLAHESGHAWHHEILKNESRCLASYPMTLAETASTFAETLIFEGALKAAGERGVSAEILALIEWNIQNTCQLIVDILSRFYFERDLFARREKSEIPASELCAMMLDAQKRTYGDGLDENLLHPYMWLVKVHYYSPSLAFYNFPYAFGELFSLSLYAREKAEPSTFAPTYRELLAWTGKASAACAAGHAGFDIENADFWQQGLGIIAENIDMFEKSVYSR